MHVVWSELAFWLLVGLGAVTLTIGFAIVVWRGVARIRGRTPVVCPDDGQRATVDVRYDAEGRPVDIAACSLIDGPVTCEKRCLGDVA